MTFEQRQSAFKRPTSKKDIVGDREIILVDSFQDIIPAHESRKADQVVMISPGVNLIPSNFTGPVNFVKRGNYITLQTFGREESIDKQWSPEKARISSNESIQARPYNSKWRFAAFHWRDSDGVNHILEPWQVIEGRRIEMFGHLFPDIEDRVEVKKIYSASDSNLISIAGKVPSRSKDAKFDLVLINQTRLNDSTKHYEWPRIRSNHSCDYKTWADTTFALRNHYRHCMHEVALHAAYSRQVGDKKRRIVHQPFPMITEPFTRLYLSLLHDTMKKDLSDSGSLRTRPLSHLETNPILMDAWIRYGNHDTLWVSSPTKGHKRMSQYDWQNSAAGMPIPQGKK
jgi:hypothetical protein